MAIDAVPSRDDVIARVTRRLYSSPVLRNDIRGEVAEEIVALALEPEWQLCGGDWAAFDLRHVATGLRMQVKQSAARQSWHSEDSVPPPARPRFSIAEKTGRWEGAAWISEASRNADIFVFGWHPISDKSAVHSDPAQWKFLVLLARDLPLQKSISLAALLRLAKMMSFADFAGSVRTVVSEITGQHSDRIDTLS